MTSSTISIPKLKGQADFPQWKRRIMALLQDKDYDTVIGYDPQTFDPSSSPQLDNSHARIDMKAKGLIELNIEDSILSHIISESSAHSYWVKLHDMYQSSSLSSIVCRLRSLMSCTQDGRPIQEFIGAIEQRSRELNSSGIDISDKLIAAVVMMNLDQRFAGVATALDSHDIDKVSLTKITAILLNEEGRQGQESSLLQAQVSARQRCHIHPQMSHSNEQCYSQHPHLRPKNWRPRNTPTKFDSDKQERFSSYELASSALDCTPQKNSDWCFDTGCSNHMTFDASSMSSFEPLTNKIAIQLGDNSLITASGRGRCSINFGQKQMILDNVLAVPNLGKNLYSPGQATNLGLKFFLSEDYLTIYSERNFRPPQGHVIARIRKSADNLYRFNADSVPCHETGAFAHSNEQQIPMTTWHKRLAHTNPADILHLSTTGALGSITTKDFAKPCEACILGKLPRKPFKSCDPMKTSSP